MFSMTSNNTQCMKKILVHCENETATQFCGFISSATEVMFTTAAAILKLDLDRKQKTFVVVVNARNEQKSTVNSLVVLLR